MLWWWPPQSSDDGYVLRYFAPKIGICEDLATDLRNVHWLHIGAW